MGAVYVKHYPDKIVIENPGGFLDGITADHIITHPSAPRNKLIAETLQSLKYVQRTVQYIKAKDMIIEYIKLQGYINRSTVQELCGFTDQQARRTIEKMKEENIIEMSNGGRYAKYILKEI